MFLSISGRAWIAAAAASVSLAAAAVGCGGGGGGGGGGGTVGPTPSISSVNGSTTPASPTNVAIEIEGTGFGSSPGQVVFTPSGSAAIPVLPPQSSWSDTDIIVPVPGGIAAPSSVSVVVVGSDGFKSSSVNLNVVATPSFSPSSIQWTATAPLPRPRSGAGAVAVATGTSAGWVYVVGGAEGTADVSSVLVAALASDGTVGPWRPTSPLPAARAYIALAEADSARAPVPSGSAFLYAVGGQQTATDAPGGTSTVFVGSVNAATGDVTWSASSSLPETRVGCAAVVANGFLLVTGGLDSSGHTVGATASAPIQSNGFLGSFTDGASLPAPVAFHASFAFGGYVYVVDGDRGPVTAPASGSATAATNNAFLAPVRAGVVGTWTATSGGIKPRSNLALLFAFGQVLVYEGLYGNTNFEAERSTVNADGTLGSWNGQTGSSIPGLGTFNTAGVSSPILTASGSPRFLLIGGALVAAPSTQTATVDRTSAP